LEDEKDRESVGLFIYHNKFVQCSYIFQPSLHPLVASGAKFSVEECAHDMYSLAAKALHQQSHVAVNHLKRIQYSWLGYLWDNSV